MIKITDSIVKIPPSKLEEFAMMINIDDFWKVMAGKILTRDKSKYRFTITDIENLSRDKNPGKLMLLTWVTDNIKIKDLINLCSQLNLNRYIEFFKKFVEFEEKENNIYSKEILFESLLTWTNNFNIENLIDRGGFSSVYKAMDTLTNKQYAVKKINSDNENISYDQLKNELLFVSKCQHKNLIDIIGYTVEDNIFYIIYKLALHGSLHNQLFQRGAYLNCRLRFNILNDITDGLCYIHSMQFIHRDIKPSNILLDNDYVAKLCDYGLAKFVNNEWVNTELQAGTPGYIPPEAIYEGKISEKTDVYSFGIVILEIISGLRSCDNDREQPILIDHINITCKSDISLIKDPKVNDWNISLLDMLLKLSKQCLDIDDCNRPRMNVIQNMLSKFA